MNEKYSFSLTDDGVQSVVTNDRTFFDRSPVTPRDEAMYELLKDTFPSSMSIKEYRALSFCQSQYSILLEEPDRYVMPQKGQVCVDAGSFVGYKAMAMADIAGPSGSVLAIELDANSHDLQQRCFKTNNVESYVEGLNLALGPEDKIQKVYTTVKGSMGNSLTAFEGMGDNLLESEVSTVRLDTVFKSKGLSYIDNLHVSVNGYEEEVLEGLGEYAHKVGVYCVMAPYTVNGVSGVEKVVGYFKRNGIKVWGKSQAAIVAGPEAGHYPVQQIPNR